MYKILETRIEFKNNNLHKVTVLVDCTSSNSKPLTDVRAIYAIAKPAYDPYVIFSPDNILSEHLLQHIASHGYQDDDRDKIFPKWKSNYAAR